MQRTHMCFHNGVLSVASDRVIATTTTLPIGSHSHFTTTIPASIDNFADRQSFKIKMIYFLGYLECRIVFKLSLQFTDWSIEKLGSENVLLLPRHNGNSFFSVL